MNDYNVNAWKEYSDEYHRNASFSKQMIHTGLGLAGIDPVDVIKSSKTVLDVGCGNGVNTFLISEKTTGNVVGIDPAENQIREAAKLIKKPNIQFLCCEFSNIFKLTDDCYDLITFFGSLDYIPIDDAFFDVLERITHEKSRCFISKFHPFWTTLYGNDVEEELNNRYFESGREDHVCFGKSKFIRYHYTFSDLFEIFANHNWILQHCREPKPTLENSAFAYKNYEYDRTLQQRLHKIPMTLILEFIREAPHADH